MGTHSLGEGHYPRVLLRLVDSTYNSKQKLAEVLPIPGVPGQIPRPPGPLTLVTMSAQVQDVEVSLELRPHHDLLQR